MASEVGICNTALSHLGDSATVASIDPPEGSAQAEHCALFYPIARDALLAMHHWSWATRRAPLALLGTNESSSWAYCYAVPGDALTVIAVLASDAADDVSASAPPGVPAGYTSQEFVRERAANGNEVIYTNQADAVLRYVARSTNTDRFSPLFTLTLTHMLAGLLAGPVVKGREGAAEGARQRVIAMGQDGKSGLCAQAIGADASQRMSNWRDRHQVPWLNGR